MFRTFHTAEEIYTYAIENNGVLNHLKINKLIENLGKIKNPEYIYLFARNIVGLTKSDLTKLTDCICNTKDLHYMYYFAKDIPGLENEHYEKIVDYVCSLTVKKPKTGAVYLYNIASSAVKLDSSLKNKLARFMSETNSSYYIYHFASTVTLLDENSQNSLTKAIAQAREPYYICLFVKNVSFLTNEHMITLAEAICNCGSYGDICEFSQNALVLPTEACNILTSAIISSDSAEYIYRFAKNTFALGIANKKKLMIAMYKTNDIKMIQLFSQEILGIFHKEIPDGKTVKELFAGNLSLTHNPSNRNVIKNIINKIGSTQKYESLEQLYLAMCTSIECTSEEIYIVHQCMQQNSEKENQKTMTYYSKYKT